MIHLDLSAEETEILIDTLNNDLGDLGMEIADTDRLDYREMLKKRKGVLLRTIEAIRKGSGSSAP